MTDNETIITRETEEADKIKKAAEEMARQEKKKASDAENRRTAMECKRKCKTKEIKESAGEVLKVADEVADFCSSTPCSGEMEKIREQAMAIRRQAAELSTTSSTEASAFSSESSSSSSSYFSSSSSSAQ